MSNQYTANPADSARRSQPPQGAGRRLLLVAAAFLALMSWARPAVCQTPFPSYAYIVGRNFARDMAGGGKTLGGDGLADIWIAFVHRNIAASLPHGSGYFVKWMKLYHPTLPGYRWDTIPGSGAPLLVVTLDQGRQVLNRQDGSIDGLNLATEGRLDLYVSDPTFRLAVNLKGLILEVGTTDGTMSIAVEPSNFYEHLY